MVENSYLIYSDLARLHSEFNFSFLALVLYLCGIGPTILSGGSDRLNLHDLDSYPVKSASSRVDGIAG